MTEDKKQQVLERLDDALSAMNSALLGAGYLNRVEDLENGIAFGECQSVLMHLTTLLHESGLAVPASVYQHIERAGIALNAAGAKHRAWTWERLQSPAAPAVQLGRIELP